MNLCDDRLADVYTSFLSLPQERLNQTNLAVVIPTFSLHLRITEYSYSDCTGMFGSEE